MLESKYDEAAVQVLDVLNYTKVEDVEKIPQSFIKFLTNIANKKYNSNLNHELEIEQLNITEKTRELLGFMYITWWCNEDERKKYKNEIQKKSVKKTKEFYKINDIFEDKKQPKIFQNEETSIAEVKQENLFEKIFNKILSVFKIKK